jgi:hypothetical protein
MKHYSIHSDLFKQDCMLNECATAGTALHFEEENRVVALV